MPSVRFPDLDADPATDPATGVTAARQWRAMGTRAKALVVGPADLADLAVERIERLEAAWSRFRPDSDVSRLARAGGREVAIDPSTARLVATMVEAHRRTGGMYDPAVGATVAALGYDRDLPAVLAARPPVVVAPPAPPPGWATALCWGGSPDEPTLAVPAGVVLDPGGIGKGLAADMVAEELRLAGAEGVLIDLGGDVVARGAAPGLDHAWVVAVEDPFDPTAELARVGLRDGAVATSSVLRRRWSVRSPEGPTIVHHLIDPTTGAPASGVRVTASVVAGEGWWAEVLAKVALLRGLAAVRPIGGGTVSALVVDRWGCVLHDDPGGHWHRPGHDDGSAMKGFPT